MDQEKSSETRTLQVASRERVIEAHRQLPEPGALHATPLDLRSAAPRLRAPSNASTGCVLAAAEFDRCLTRERSLADRGTRLFSLLVLRHVEGASDGWKRLPQAIRARVRSTDLVGFLDASRVAVLLSDTGPTGARVVASWIDRLTLELGTRIEPALYVYPSAPVATEDPTSGHANGSMNGHSNGHANGSSNGHANGHANGHSNGHANGHAIAPVDGTLEEGARRWPEADLWTQLSSAMPWWKRSLDVVVSGLALVVLSPLLLAIAAAIKLETPGPVLFRQVRAGRGARPFVFYKFRSMFADAEQRRAGLEALNEKDGPIFKIQDDPRITRVGRLLRRWSLDELPQFWNILKGDISLVGPRSPTFNEVAKYERWQRPRLSVTGGITCIWQVSGRSRLSFLEWMRMDLEYVQRRCLWFDLWLLARTLPAVLSGRGAC